MDPRGPSKCAVVNDAQTRYALASARVELRLAELREALDRHEADGANWERTEVLERVERGLAELARELARS
jgi:hypothetical protein